MSDGSIYGLFVGINRYESEDIRPLAFASADVVAVRSKLAERFGLDAERAVVLADGISEGKAPTRREILRAMNRFTGAPMGPRDAFFLVFAGHGFVCSGRTYLAAADSEIGSEALLRETAVSLDSIRDFLAEIKAGEHVVILDACRDSPVRGTRSVGSQSMSDAMTRDIGTVIRAPSGDGPGITRAKAILCSCWEGQVAYEYPQGGHGWFCYNLLAELDEGSAGELSISELHGKVKRRMRKTAWRLLPAAREQSPHLLIEGDVPALRPSAFAAGLGLALVTRTEPSGAAPGIATHLSGEMATANKDSLPIDDAGATGRPCLDAAGRLESDLLNRCPRAVLQALSASPSTSPRAQVLGCIARLMITPMRKLRNHEANDLVGQLAELAVTDQRPMALLLLAALSDHYYRPLKRKFPSAVFADTAQHPTLGLDASTTQLGALVPEVADILKQWRGATT